MRVSQDRQPEQGKVLGMATLLYLNYLIVASSQFDHVKGWDIWVSVQWHLGDTLRSKILDPANRFKTKDEAEQFGFEVGKDWVDKRTKLH